MAAGNVVVYMEALKATALQSINWASNTFVAHLVSHGYAPNYSSDSAWDDVSVYQLTTSGYTSRTIVSNGISQPSDSHVRFDADDITFSASSTMTAKYCVLEHQTTGRVVNYVDLETATTSGVDATQIVVQWNASGIYQFTNSGT